MLTLRVATPADGAVLSEIYAYYVNTSAISYEYVAPDAKEFAERIAHKLEKYPYIVAELDGKPVGYAYASEFRERAAYAWCVELSVYVDRSCRGRGVGSTLYTALLDGAHWHKPDHYFILKDFVSYAEAQKRVEEKYRDERGWAKSALINIAKSGKFSSDRTIEEYVQDIWHLEKVTVKKSTKK